MDTAFINNHWQPPAQPDFRLGIVGVPPRALIKRCNDQGLTIHDLDARLVELDQESVSAYLPRVYCAILRTVVMNALVLELDAIVIDVGRGKCDCAFQVAAILEDTLHIPIIRTANEDQEGCGTPISHSALELTAKMLAITATVKEAQPRLPPLVACTPTAGFWGVPPRDFSILAPFPATTHVYGWSRCLENKTPADHLLEGYYNPTVPTVFFAQSFCAKTAQAKYLAAKHPRALYLDVDYHTSNSAKAKVQAFLELSGAYR